ncbi:serine/threonine-protein phosphatase [Propioniciclava coleopterorum]|uniref:Serine/threonine-protein phosphatase n=1 Tax=Propioniciclava coleopterorum TaxID=2714937 RepID=A0A6G7Y2V7_9ACTN|nr:protein phosphatase 2C domain-containing protein [Propioniciclava coleopterorum]QIK71039.1 serine/threonine-protein phosphatase [Propioniciclava coleopterorum]
MITWGARTDVGRVRQGNEDAHLAVDGLWLVSDGMGGHAAGEVASRIVVETFAPLARRRDLRAADLVAAVHAANEAIKSYGAEHPRARGLGATVTGVARVTLAGAPRWAILNVGDSRVYRLVGDTLGRATIDHSETEELVLEGVISPEEARTHHARNIVTRSLGQRDPLQPDLWLLPPAASERFVVCSDGLNSEVGDGDIRAILLAEPDPQRAADALVEAALAAGGRDNVSVVVVDAGSAG